jgi:hypothetical protein
MPTTIVALIIVLFAALPGVPAHNIYKTFIGSDWRETEWEKLVNVIGFSLGGMVVYVVVSSITSLPPPLYVLPSTFELTSFGVTTLLPIALSLLGHFISAALVAIVAILGIRFFGKWAPSTPYPAAWDDFIRVDVPKHWVVVRLANGEAYAGFIKNADISVSQSERDLVLSEPALFSEKDSNYKVIPYQQLFLPSSMISSIAVVHNPEIDPRITEIGSNLFSEGVTNARK